MKERPRSAKAHAYLGLYLGMSAGRTSDFSEAGKLVQAAFAQLDQAAAIDSLDIDARYFRGLLSVEVPDFFGRLDPGVRDLEFVLARPEKTRKPLDHELKGQPETKGVPLLCHRRSVPGPAAESRHR